MPKSTGLKQFDKVIKTEDIMGLTDVFCPISLCTDKKCTCNDED
jgi:hypothetical protein